VQVEKPSKVPKKKVAAAGVGGGLGGNVAVILAFHLPDLPPEVVAAYTALLVTILALLSAYLTPEKA
jgi:hypothetical protein